MDVFDCIKSMGLGMGGYSVTYTTGNGSWSFIACWKLTYYYYY